VTKVIQLKLFAVMSQLPVNEFGPRVLIACPESEFHEIGAQAVAYLAATRGCHVYYLGSNLPISELRTFCERVHPDMILLSLTEGKSDTGAHQLLHELKLLSMRWPVGVGGQGARAIEHLLQGSGIELLDDLAVLNNRLASLLSTRLRAAQS
jgi:methanogenic corrinoid protein MtbC1